MNRALRLSPATRCTFRAAFAGQCRDSTRPSLNRLGRGGFLLPFTGKVQPGKLDPEPGSALPYAPEMFVADGLLHRNRRRPEGTV